MDDSVDAVSVGQPCHRLPVADVALSERDAALPFRDELPHQGVGGSDVVADDLVPGPGQLPDNVRSHKPGSPGYQRSHSRASESEYLFAVVDQL